MDADDEEEKLEQDIEEDSFYQKKSENQRVRFHFLSVGANQDDQQHQQHNSFDEGRDADSLFSYKSLGMHDVGNIRYKKKWVFYQLKKMQFNDNNIIFCLERIQNIATLSCTEILQIAANNIPDEMELIEQSEDTYEFQDIINKAKQLYQIGSTKLQRFMRTSYDQHNQEQFPSDLLIFNKKNQQRLRKSLSSISQLHQNKTIINIENWNSSIIVSSNSNAMIECTICCEQFLAADNKFLLPCQHQFCQECLKQYILEKINCCQVLQIVCPQEGCTEQYADSAIKAIIQEEHQIERYIKFKQRQQLSQDPDIRWCIRAGCNYAIKGQKDNPKLICPQCEIEICYFCTNQWHQDLTCEQAIDEEYQKMAQNFKVKLCPSCKSKIQKNEGCNHMTCPRCFYEFCWLCVNKYSPGHFSSSNFRGCPGLMYSQRIPPCFRLLIIMKFSAKIFGLFLLGVLAISLLPAILVLASIAFPTITYFVIKKDYDHDRTSLFSEIFKISLLILIGFCTFPLNLVMAIFPGIFVGIAVCISN